MIKKAEKEYIFGDGQITKSCHASTILPLDDGTVVAAWFGGLHEKDKSVEIYVSVRDLNKKWSTPVCVSENDSIPHWNPVLLRLSDGGIMLFYKYGEEIPDWITKFVTSYDNGKTWSEPQVLVEGDKRGGRGPVKNKCLRLENGTLLAPASTEKKKWICFIDKSEDDGKNWQPTDYFERPKYHGKFVNLIQPTLWKSTDGNVHCFMRSDASAVYRSDSADDGKTWCKPYRTKIPNNNSGIDCTTDMSGRLWLVYNPVDVNWGVRHPLLLSVSTDNGKKFNPIINLEPGNGEFSYPAIVSHGNKLYVTYTHKRRQIVFWEIELE